VVKKILGAVGIMAFWASWPISFIYLRLHERTRVLLITGEQVLLVRTWHGPGSWSLPGGGMHKNETKEQAAVRELMEEVGIGLGIEQLKPLGTKKHHEYKLSFTCHYFVAVLPESIQAYPSLPEILDARWVFRKDLAGYKLGPDAEYALLAQGALVQ
jgi:8-oxo-dGTP pyrophosphatase MutT (NUDIX family)